MLCFCNTFGTLALFFFFCELCDSRKQAEGEGKLARENLTDFVGVPWLCFSSAWISTASIRSSEAIAEKEIDVRRAHSSVWEMQQSKTYLSRPSGETEVVDREKKKVVKQRQLVTPAMDEKKPTSDEAQHIRFLNCKFRHKQTRGHNHDELPKHGHASNMLERYSS